MADCFCIKGSSETGGYDFHVQVIDKETIVYNDLSRWVEDDRHIIPTEHQILITTPDSSIYPVNVTPRATTVIKASDLGISKFKDGIYCFTIDGDNTESGGCGVTRTKTTGIFPNIECCLFAAYSKLDDDRYEDVHEVEMWLNSAKSSSELGMEKAALSEYKIAKRKLNKLNCDCNC